MMPTNSATNAAEKLAVTDKMLDALAVAMNPLNRFLAFEGTVRAIKTVTAILAFHYRVQASKNKFHLIGGRNLDVIRRNLLEADLGLLTMFPHKYKLDRDKIGGYFIRCIGTDKEIIILGYADRTRWESLSGASIENVFLDEINLANEQFLDETFARQVACVSPFTIATLNGDDPQSKCYVDYINHCKIIGDCPASTRADMDKYEKKRGWRYMFFTFYDNPIMTPQMIEAAEGLFPKGSYYYKTRTLGERGTWGTLIFNDYMADDLIIDAFEKKPNGRPLHEIVTYTIGGDIAENRAANVFALMGFDSTKSYCYLIDILAFPSVNGNKRGYTYKTEMLRGFLARHQDKPIEYIAIDSAEGNYINDLKGSNLGVPIIPSYKATIKERIDMNIILFSGKRFFFHKDRNTDTTMAYKAFQAAKWVDGKEGAEREDLGQQMNDIMDAVEYGQTRYMTALTTARGRDRK